jgi:hypothetical protein
LRSIAHIIHPVAVPPSSDLVVAQPITFETMRLARMHAAGYADISLFYCTYADESPVLPRSFHSAGKLVQSVTDTKHFKKKRKLALIKDILDRLYASSNAEYFIYTNVDIAVMPYFYTLVDHIIGQGYDAFVINRRTIPEGYRDIVDLPLMYAEAGIAHPGHDCFVFKRNRYARYHLENACIGCNWIGKVMLFNQVRHAAKFGEFSDLHATFHIGDRRDWKRPEYEEYDQHNADVLAQITRRYKHDPAFCRHPIVKRVVDRLELAY